MEEGLFSTMGLYNKITLWANAHAGRRRLYPNRPTCTQAEKLTVGSLQGFCTFCCVMVLNYSCFIVNDFVLKVISQFWVCGLFHVSLWRDFSRFLVLRFLFLIRVRLFHFFAPFFLVFAPVQYLCSLLFSCVLMLSKISQRFLVFLIFFFCPRVQDLRLWFWILHHPHVIVCLLEWHSGCDRKPLCCVICTWAQHPVPMFKALRQGSIIYQGVKW